MVKSARVVTASLPGELVNELDRVSRQIDRSKSWIIRAALNDWLKEEKRRYELTFEALASVDQGKSYTQEEVLAWFAERKRLRD